MLASMPGIKSSAKKSSSTMPTLLQVDRNYSNFAKIYGSQCYKARHLSKFDRMEQITSSVSAVEKQVTFLGALPEWQHHGLAAPKGLWAIL
jgi:hypothetical protein